MCLQFPIFDFGFLVLRSMDAGLMAMNGCRRNWKRIIILVILYGFSSCRREGGKDGSETVHGDGERGKLAIRY